MWDAEGAKEVVPPETEHYHQHRYGDVPPGFFAHGRNAEHDDDREFFGLSRKRFFVMVALPIILIIAVGLGVGIGVELGMDDNK